MGYFLLGTTLAVAICIVTEYGQKRYGRKRN